MKYKNFIILLFIILSGLSGCISAGKNRSGKLSEAMDIASDKYTEERKVETEPAADDLDEIEVGDDTLAVNIDASNFQPSKPSDEVIIRDDISEQSVSVKFGSGAVSNSDYLALKNYSINLQYRNSDENGLEFHFGYSKLGLKNRHKLYPSIKSNLRFYEFGMEFLHYTTPTHTFLGHYFLFGIEYNLLSWNYKNPFYANIYDDFGELTGEELVKNDKLSGLDVHIGNGFNLLQTRKFKLGFEVIPGIKFWWFKTYEGFDNDIFDPYPYIKFRFVLNFNLTPE